MDADITDRDREVDGGSVRPLMGEDAFRASCAKEMALLALMEKTGYNIVQENGQRKYGGPPPDWEGPPPPRGCEVFVGKIPRDIYEDELVPLFGRAGEIYEFRLMMEFSGENRGYAFAMYTNREAAHRAIQMLDNYQIRPRKFIGVCVSLNNCRLVIFPIPKDKRKDQIMEEMKKVTDGVVDVILVSSTPDMETNPGFAFVEYECHKAAVKARRKLIPGPFQLWGQSIQVDWGEPSIIKYFRVLYVQNLMQNTTEDTLREEFSRFKPGSVERVKKLTDYAFIYYRSFNDALAAFSHMNGVQIDGATVNMTLTKPRGLKGGVAGRKPRNRAYASGGDVLEFHRNNGGMGTSGEECPPIRTYSPCLENPFSSTGDHADRRMFPWAPSTQLITTSLLSVSQTQMRSAVSLLEFYCCQNQLAQPDYYLYSTPGQDGTPLLLYKVVISDTGTTYMPNKLCLLLEEAKELAAQTALSDLVLPPPNSLALCSCLPPPRPMSPLPTLSILPYAPPGTQRPYISPQSPFY